jgi:RNA polymerase sigma-70 factor (ECF subfamily)
MVDVEESREPTSGTDRGGRESFERLYRDHFEAVYAYILRRAGRTDASDLVEDVFATAWRRMADVPAAPESKLWLYGVARHVVSQHRRSTTRGERLKWKMRRNTNVVTLDAAPEVSDLESKVRGLIQSMKDEDRELVTLIIWDGLTHAEVASVLGCSVNAVRIRWHRTVKRLRRQIGAEPAISPQRPNPTAIEPLTEES